VKGELDLFAGLLLERGDDLPDRRVLPGVVALVPPDDEVSGLHAERGYEQGRGEGNGSTAHIHLLKSRWSMLGRLRLFAKRQRRSSWRRSGQGDTIGPMRRGGSG
jgi:hypothetical protein